MKPVTFDQKAQSRLYHLTQVTMEYYQLLPENGHGTYLLTKGTENTAFDMQFLPPFLAHLTLSPLRSH